MDFPSWFGKTEYYALLSTLWFVMIIYLWVNIIRVKSSFSLSGWFKKIKKWIDVHKKNREEKLLGGDIGYGVER